MSDSVGQGIRNLLGYGFDPSYEFSESAKIAASSLPLVKGIEEI
jgi:hypothetical protein